MLLEALLAVSPRFIGLVVLCTRPSEDIGPVQPFRSSVVRECIQDCARGPVPSFGMRSAVGSAAQLTQHRSEHISQGASHLVVFQRVRTRRANRKRIGDLGKQRRGVQQVQQPQLGGAVIDDLEIQQARSLRVEVSRLHVLHTHLSFSLVGHNCGDGVGHHRPRGKHQSLRQPRLTDTVNRVVQQ